MVTGGIGEGLGMAFSDTYNRQTVDAFAVLSSSFFNPMILIKK